MNRNRRLPDNSADCSWLFRLGRCGLIWIALAPCPRPQDGPQFGPRTLHDSGPSTTQFQTTERPTTVSWDEQQLRGAGPGYQVQFDDQGFVLSTDGDATIRGVTELVGRRSPKSLDAKPVAPGLPVSDPQGVSYQRGPVVERYDVRADGVELSYVFEELPRGAGDLVVRLKVATTLNASVQNTRADALTFDVGERPAISVGAVTGVDANGQRVQGSMRFDDDVLALVLPEQFVETAALPLTLDPVIGSVKYRTGSGTGYKQAAYDPVNDVFAVLWDSGPSPSSARMLVQLLTPSGALLGAPIVVGQWGLPGGDVANVAARGRFLISYGFATATYLRTLDPVSRNLSPATPAPGLVWLSGNMSSNGQALGVFVQGTGLSVAAVDVDLAGNISIQGPVPLTNALFPYPDVSATAGAHARHMVVWTECNGPCSAANGDIWGAIIGKDGTVLDILPIANSPRNEYAPSVDGDGRQWLVSYGVFSRTTQLSDVECASVFWDSNSARAYVESRVPLAADPSMDETPRSVLLTGGSYITSYDDLLPVQYNGGEHLLLVDAIDGRVIARGPRYQTGSDLLGASQHWRRSGPGDIAMLVDGAFAYWYRVDDGITTDLGGGCGRGGHIGVSGAVSKLKTMTLHLRDALPAVPAVLILGSSTVNLACGTCTLVPDPASGIALPLGVTDNHGNASVQVPITNLYAATFIEQWAILGGNACALGLELSNAVQVQIQ